MANTARRSLRHQIADNLRAQVLAGELHPGTQLPSEPELARSLHVSRSSLRAAIALLEEEGLLRRLQGSGTYVNDRPLLRDDLSRNLSVSAMIRSTGQVPGALRSQAALEPAPAEVAEAFGMTEGATVSALRRVRTADGKPVVDSIDWCRPEALAPDELTELGGGSVYLALADRGIAIHHGVARLYPTVASRKLAARMEVPAGSLLLTLFQVDSTDNGVVALVSREHYLADAFEISLYRRGPGDGDGGGP